MKKRLKKKLEKRLKKRLKKNSIFFSIFLSIFPYDHGKDSTEIQFCADFPLISCGEKKYWNKYWKNTEKNTDFFFCIILLHFFLYFQMDVANVIIDHKVVSMLKARNSWKLAQSITYVQYTLACINPFAKRQESRPEL